MSNPNNPNNPNNPDNPNNPNNPNIPNNPNNPNPLWWTDDEIERLNNAVFILGPRNWNNIARQVRTRTSVECQTIWRRLTYYNSLNLNRPATLNLGMSQRFLVNYRNMAQNGQSQGQNSISLTAILTNPIQQNTRMSIDYILTHDRDMRMTIYYITI